MYRTVGSGVSFSDRGRQVNLMTDALGDLYAYGTLSGARAGDRVWLDHSNGTWNEKAYPSTAEVEAKGGWEQCAIATPVLPVLTTKTPVVRNDVRAVRVCFDPVDGDCGSDCCGEWYVDGGPEEDSVKPAPDRDERPDADGSPGTSVPRAQPNGASVSGDARAEIIMVREDGTVAAYKNVNGLNGFPFSDPVVIGTDWYEPERVRFADIDGDRRNEIIMIHEDGTVAAYENVNGMNGFPFTDPVVIGTDWYVPERVHFADIDGDGRDEIIMVREDGTVAAYENVNGLNGFPFTDPVVIGTDWHEPERVHFADINGDGRDEIIMVHKDGTVAAYENVNGLNGFPFTDPVVIGTDWHEPERVRFADIDGDGRDEIIMLRPDGNVAAYENVNGLNGFPFTDPVVIGTDWYVPGRTFFG